MKKSGMTIVEILIVSGLLVVLISVFIEIGKRGNRIMEDSSKEIQLQTGVRAFLENLVQDMNSAIAVVGPMDKSIVIARYDKPVDNDLVVANADNPTFPFYIDGAQTILKIPCLFVQYQWHDPQFPDASTLEFLSDHPGAISRITKRGTLLGMDMPEGNLYSIDEYKAIGEGGGDLKSVTPLSKKIIAKQVNFLRYQYFGNDRETGQLKQISSLGSDAASNALISMIAVHIKAEDTPKDQTMQTRSVEIATKIWSLRRIQENKYPEYFGHTDADFRF